MSTIPAELFVNVDPSVLAVGGTGNDILGLMLSSPWRRFTSRASTRRIRRRAACSSLSTTPQTSVRICGAAPSPR
jgi:hypothetical protein